MGNKENTGGKGVDLLAILRRLAPKIGQVEKEERGEIPTGDVPQSTGELQPPLSEPTPPNQNSQNQ